MNCETHILQNGMDVWHVKRMTTMSAWNVYTMVWLDTSSAFAYIFFLVHSFLSFMMPFFLLIYVCAAEIQTAKSIFNLENGFSCPFILIRNYYILFSISTSLLLLPTKKKKKKK